MLTKRMKICLIVGSILGVFCIIGASLRSPGSSTSFLFALWYNRLLMGLVIGLSAKSLSFGKAIGRGAFLGFIISFAFYSSTCFYDIVSFLAGVIYGMVIEIIAFKMGD
ncbi:MAG: hypothetical protein JXC36_00370 [Candidatus Atribacteria bacterium]|nr:hypothetical protein [Candidatus Atribacteria bacterium]